MTGTPPLRDRIEHALLTAISSRWPGSAAEHHGDDHRYSITCALCSKDLPGLLAAVLAAVQPELDQRDAENERLRMVAQAAATLLRSTHDKTAAGRPLDLDTIRHAATALDDITTPS